LSKIIEAQGQAFSLMTDCIKIPVVMVALKIA
jgi:hypothetical protein